MSQRSPRPRPANERRSLPLVVDAEQLFDVDVASEGILRVGISRPLEIRRSLMAGRSSRDQAKAAAVNAVLADWRVLPRNRALLDYLAAQRAEGREIHLVSRGSPATARDIAAGFGLFDTAQGEAAATSSEQRAERLSGALPNGFIYAGTRSSDLPIWRSAAGVLLLKGTPGHRRRAKSLGLDVEAHAVRTRPRPAAWMRAFRPHQWSKNLLLFAPLFLSGRFSNPLDMIQTIYAFLLTGLVASGAYLVNDLLDLPSDRQHRSKSVRPLASGDLPARQAMIAAPLLLAVALVLAVWLSPPFATSLLLYLVVTLSYSIRLKRLAIVDAIVLASLYTLRLLMGTTLIDVPFSPWLLTFATFFFFSLAMAKRHVEVVGATSASNEFLPGRGYLPTDAPLTLSLGVSSGMASVLVVVQYLMAEAFPSGVYKSPVFLWAIPIVISLWILRIWLLAHREILDDDPVAFALRDRVSIVLGATLGVVFLLAHFI